MALTLKAGTASVVVDLLELLSELPSTPDVVREQARDHVALIEEHRPARQRHLEAGARAPGEPVELESVDVTAIAGLLDLLAGLPSTPPAVIDDAESYAARLWEAVNAEDEPPASDGRMG